MNTCQPIDHILKLSEAEGNTILSISKSELMDKVIWMNSELSSALRNKIFSDIDRIEYKKTKDKPHDPGKEYFVCNECKTVIVFPLKAAS
ncbi:MAG: hypothetical protein LEGION0398_MBIBDBAK_00197 [Legionellaceae bacterium]